MTTDTAEGVPFDAAWAEHVAYARRTADALKTFLVTADRALRQASKELRELGNITCDGECCGAVSDIGDAEHEHQVAMRALRHMERVADDLSRRAASVTTEETTP